DRLENIKVHTRLRRACLTSMVLIGFLIPQSLRLVLQALVLVQPIKVFGQL
uniref:Uncharacterized protein n=1 Tax=Aegilops tauschii subsp. strangulata TaxID=200361 RepID=A0A453L995_AEGTS